MREDVPVCTSNRTLNACPLGNAAVCSMIAVLLRHGLHIRVQANEIGSVLFDCCHQSQQSHM